MAIAQVGPISQVGSNTAQKIYLLKMPSTEFPFSNNGENIQRNPTLNTINPAVSFKMFWRSALATILGAATSFMIVPNVASYTINPPHVMVVPKPQPGFWWIHNLAPSAGQDLFKILGLTWAQIAKMNPNDETVIGINTAIASGFMPDLIANGTNPVEAYGRIQSVITPHPHVYSIPWSYGAVSDEHLTNLGIERHILDSSKLQPGQRAFLGLDEESINLRREFAKFLKASFTGYGLTAEKLSQRFSKNVSIETSQKGHLEFVFDGIQPDELLNQGIFFEDFMQPALEIYTDSIRNLDESLVDLKAQPWFAHNEIFSKIFEFMNEKGRRLTAEENEQYRSVPIFRTQEAAREIAQQHGIHSELIDAVYPYVQNRQELGNCTQEKSLSMASYRRGGGGGLVITSQENRTKIIFLTGLLVNSPGAHFENHRGDILLERLPKSNRKSVFNKNCLEAHGTISAFVQNELLQQKLLDRQGLRKGLTLLGRRLIRGT